MRFSKTDWAAVLLVVFLLIANFTVWGSIYEKSQRILKVAFLDVGQGDAIYIKSPTGKDVLIDGGPTTNKVLSSLGSVMSLGDNEIDLVIATHPDADHTGGLPAVLARYSVGAVLEPGVHASTQVYKSFEDEILEQGRPHVLARRRERIDLGGGAVLDILFPDRDVSRVKNTNDGSIVARLLYGSSCFLFTGDAPVVVEQTILAHKENISCEVLKLGHHGSKTSTSQAFLNAVRPSIGIVSAGLNNRYGHPHPEVIGRLKTASTTIYSTITLGTITFTSDGQRASRK